MIDPTPDAAAESVPAQLQEPEKVKPPRRKPAKARAPPRPSLPQQQQQRDKEFASHKAHILANLKANACDLSPKGSVDVKCLPVMDVLNTHTDFVTTSSCSGRIALFHHIPHAAVEEASADGSNSTTTTTASASKPRMKRGDGVALGWVFVKHGLLRPQEMAQVVRFLCGAAATPEEVALDTAQVARHTAHMDAVVASGTSDAATAVPGLYDGEVEGALVETPTLAVPTRGTVSLKMEPFVMHVECRTVEAAKTLLSAAVSDSGYRNSGVVPPGRKVMCGIRSAAGLGLEVPLVLHGINHSADQRAYVWALLGLANEKMAANERRIQLLEKSVAARVGRASGAPTQ